MDGWVTDLSRLLAQMAWSLQTCQHVLHVLQPSQYTTGKDEIVWKLTWIMLTSA